MLGPNIEVIKPCLPKSIRFLGNIHTGGAPCLAVFASHGTAATIQTPNHTEFQRLNGSRQRGPLWFAHQ